MSSPLSLLLKKKNELTKQTQRATITDSQIDRLLLKLENANKRKLGQINGIETAERIMQKHAKGAINQACSLQKNTLFQMILAVHPLSMETAMGRLMASFLSSAEIKAVRSTCRAMACFVHVQCYETAVPRDVYLGKDMHGWNIRGLRYELTFKSRINI